MASVPQLLDAAVAALGGTHRAGQVEMAEAVADAISTHTHLLVQAGTGTGKSLGYLIPAAEHAVRTGKPAVIATATLALQSQIVNRDLPAMAAAVTGTLGRTPTFALVKGRRNYLCAYKLEGGYPDEDALLDVGAVDEAAGQLGRDVVRVRQWAEQTDTGDRDDLTPGVSERAWRQVSVSARECLGAKCPLVAQCFVERSREAARDADLVVTNHAFLAIDAFDERSLLPEHDVVIVDEGHELTDRVTTTVSAELTAGAISAAATKARSADSSDALTDVAIQFEAALNDLEPGRLRHGLSDTLALSITMVLDSCRRIQSELKPEPGRETDPGRAVARAGIDEIFDTATRLLEGRALDVVWITKDERRGATLRVAPLSVADELRDKLFDHRTVILTSATLELGGSFEVLAGTLGLSDPDGPAWRGLDVGSPFDYPNQAIAYVAKQLPAPGRDGTPDEVLDEIEALITAAGGRTLGLFSSMRAAQYAAEQLRERLPQTTILCQGEDQVPTLVRQFADESDTCLFGTLTLWQGVDVPGPACQLVIIDRIPFPRPDDPLSSARSEAVAARGGNGFMAVSATHAALRLAQGAGRLIRRANDRGVVAFLDPRMVTARYASFLQRSLPPFWPTTNRSLVLEALARLDAAAEESGASEPEVTPTDPGPSGPPGPSSTRTAVTHGHAWSAADDETLRDGIEIGADLSEIADQLELPEEVVAARIEILELVSDNHDKLAP